MTSRSPVIEHYSLPGYLLLLYAVGCLALVVYLSGRPLLAPAPGVKPAPWKPPALVNFSSMVDVAQRKRAFVAYFVPLIEHQNQQLSQQRQQLLDLQLSLQAGPLSVVQQQWLQLLAERYRVESAEDPAAQIEALLTRVDQLPPAMVLAQAAIESAWGTSRFARQAHNYFGQWCFSAGCGVVPARRRAGAEHEVAAFDSPLEALVAYYLNINSHPAYAPLRQLRATLRASGEALSGLQLVKGLESYSARGESYVRELRVIIRSNDLSRYDTLNPSPTDQP